MSRLNKSRLCYCARRGYSKNRRPKGILLFEALVAVVILATGITLVLRSFNSAIAATKAIQDYTIAAFLLQQKMFDLETKKIEERAEPAEGRFEDEFSKFSWRIGVVKEEFLPLDEVGLSVTWNAPDSPRKLSCQTYLKRPPALPS